LIRQRSVNANLSIRKWGKTFSRVQACVIGPAPKME
jgi:hypothetical protein